MTAWTCRLPEVFNSVRPLQSRVNLPAPDYRAHVSFVATVLATLAVLQYAGIFYDDPGRVDPTFLLGVGVLLVVWSYVLTVILANVDALPQWERMVRDEPPENAR